MALRILTEQEKQLAQTSGISESSLQEELSRFPSLNVDAAIGNILTRPKETIEQVPGVGTITRIPRTLTEPLAPKPENTAGLLARQGITSAPPLPSVETQNLTSGVRQFYRIGKDIFEAGTGRHIGPTEWNRDWTGRAQEVAAPAEKVQLTAGEKNDVPVFGGNLLRKDADYGAQLLDIYKAYSAKSEELEKKIAEGYQPSEEEKSIRAQFQAAKESLQKFDLDALKRIEGLSGQGRGITLSTLAKMQDKERRLSALDRLGLAQELQTYAERLGLAQEERKSGQEFNRALLESSAKRLDLALGISKEMNRISREEKDDARAFILDLLAFTNGQTFDELSPALRERITEQVANSPLSLDMVKAALLNAKLKPERDLISRFALEYPDAGISLADTLSTAQEKVKRSASYLKSLKSSTAGPSKTETFFKETESELNESRGEDGFVNTALYGQKYKDYLMKGGKPETFFNIFPPKEYLNPNDATAQFYRDVVDNSDIRDLAL